MTSEEIQRLVRQLGDALTVLEQANPADEAIVYAELGLSLTYHHEERRRGRGLTRTGMQ
jgi:hypothetical protein